MTDQDLIARLRDTRANADPIKVRRLLMDAADRLEELAAAVKAISGPSGDLQFVGGPVLPPMHPKPAQRPSKSRTIG